MQRSSKPFRNTYYSDESDEEIPHYLPQYTQTHSAQPSHLDERKWDQYQSEGQSHSKPLVNPSTRFDRKLHNSSDATDLHHSSASSSEPSRQYHSDYSSSDRPQEAGSVASDPSKQATLRYPSNLKQEYTGGFELAVGWTDITPEDAAELHAGMSGYTHRGQFSSALDRENYPYRTGKFRRETPTSPGMQHKIQQEGGSGEGIGNEKWQRSMLRQILPGASLSGPKSSSMATNLAANMTSNVSSNKPFGMPSGMSSSGSGGDRRGSDFTIVRAPFTQREPSDFPSSSMMDQWRTSQQSAVSSNDAQRQPASPEGSEIRIGRRRFARGMEKEGNGRGSKPRLRNIYLHHNYYKPNEKGRELAQKTFSPESLAQMGIGPQTRPLYKPDGTIDASYTSERQKSMTYSPSSSPSEILESVSGRATPREIRSGTSPHPYGTAVHEEGRGFSDLGGDVGGEVGKEWDMPVYRPSASLLNTGHNEAYQTNLQDHMNEYDAWVSGELLSGALEPDSSSSSYTQQPSSSSSGFYGTESGSWGRGNVPSGADWQQQRGGPQWHTLSTHEQESPWRGQVAGQATGNIPSGASAGRATEHERHSAGISYGTLRPPVPVGSGDSASGSVSKRGENRMFGSRGKDEFAIRTKDQGMEPLIPQDAASQQTRVQDGKQAKSHEKSNPSTRNTNLFVTDGNSVYLMTNLDELDIPERGRYD